MWKIHQARYSLGFASTVVKHIYDESNMTKPRANSHYDQLSNIRYLFIRTKYFLHRAIRYSRHERECR